MKIDKKKLEIALARACKSYSDLNVGMSTLSKIRRGEDVRVKSVGKIAQTIGCDVLEIIAEE